VTSMDLVPELIVDSQDYIGESPAWDATERRLLWTDNVQAVVHEARPDGAGAWRETGRWDLGRPLSAVIPRAGGGLLIASGTELLLLGKDGELTPFASVDARGVEVRLNDGKCDARGRLWAGTLDTDIAVAGRPVTPGRCALYRIDPNGSAEIVLDGLTLSNGLDWSPDGRIFYHIDTAARRIDAFDFDMDAGAIANRRTIVQLSAEDGGLPDGLCVDAEGCLWVAMVGRSEVWRYAASGERLGRVKVASAATSCAFGGSDGSDLFITTSRALLPEAFLKYGFTHGVDMREAVGSGITPGAGGLYRVRPGVSGPSARPFGG
jgi:sugar lactone lactonase YvrE